jgi:hypothetical protein
MYYTAADHLVALVTACWSANAVNLQSTKSPTTHISGESGEPLKEASSLLEFLAQLKYGIVYKPSVENPVDPLNVSLWWVSCIGWHPARPLMLLLRLPYL